MISTRLVDPEVVEAARAWYAAGASSPFVVDDVLDTDSAYDIGDLMKSLPGWRHHAAVSVSDHEIFEVEPSEWPSYEMRSARHFKVDRVSSALKDQGLDLNGRRSLVDLLQGVLLGGQLQDFLGEVTSVPLSRTLGSIELAAYGKGDEILPHSDAGLNRAFAANFYLDRAMDESDGNWLWFKPARNEDAVGVAPMFNRLAIIETRPESEHWVDSRRRDERGRFTISVGVQHA